MLTGQEQSRCLKGSMAGFDSRLAAPTLQAKIAGVAQSQSTVTQIQVRQCGYISKSNESGDQFDLARTGGKEER